MFSSDKIDQILEGANTFDTGGARGTFRRRLNDYFTQHPDSPFNTPQWQRYLTLTASKESGFNSNAVGPNTRYGNGRGYFQLMPFNWKTGNQFKDIETMMSANIRQLNSIMTPKRWQAARDMGIDIYGLMAGAHLGGVGGVKKVLDSYGKANPSDRTSTHKGTTVLARMRQFSQFSNDRFPAVQEPPQLQGQSYIQQSNQQTQANSIADNIVSQIYNWDSPNPKPLDIDLSNSNTNSNDNRLNPIEPNNYTLFDLLPTSSNKYSSQPDVKITTNQQYKASPILQEILDEPFNFQSLGGKLNKAQAIDNEIGIMSNVLHNQYQQVRNTFKDGGTEDNPYKVGTLDWYVRENELRQPQRTWYPFLKDKAVTLTNAGDFTGANISTNWVDSLALNGQRAGVPLREALGLSHETTMNNPTNTKQARLMLAARNRQHYPNETRQHINKGKGVEGSDMINSQNATFWGSPFMGAINAISHTDDKGESYWDVPNPEERLMQAVPYTLKQAGSYPDYSNMTDTEAGMRFYWGNPNGYNPGGNYTDGYQSWVQRKGDMLLGSPEIQDILYDNLYNPDYEGQAFKQLYPIRSYNVPVGNIHVNEDGSISTVNTVPTITNGNIELPEVIISGRGPQWAVNLGNNLIGSTHNE